VAKRNKSALKAHRQNIKRREHNRELRSKLRTGLKAIRRSLAADDAEGAKKGLAETQSLVDKMAAKGIIHRNTASRYKSRLSARASATRTAPAKSTAKTATRTAAKTATRTAAKTAAKAAAKTAK
jgi:small subunit ribosomal protein S20